MVIEMGRRRSPEEISASPVSPGFASSLHRCLEKYREQPENAAALERLRQARREIAEICLATAPDRLQALFSTGFSGVFKAIYECDMRYEMLSVREAAFCDELTGDLRRKFQDPGATNRLLAAMLYLRADQLPLDLNRENLPQWLFPVFVRYLLDPPKFFRESGEISVYRRHLVNALAFFSRNIVSGHHRFAGNAPLVQEIIGVVLTTLPVHPVYFSDGDLKDLYTARAKLLEHSLRRIGCVIDYQPGPRKSDRKKIRVGILNTHFRPQTETFATLPVFEHLDRSKFEIYLYVIEQSGHPVERYCRERADRFYPLTEDLSHNIATLRGHELDILFMGSNITAASKSITSIALHRTARAQATSICSPVTTGMSNIDYYIAGNLALAGEKAREQYIERLITVEGSGFCFSFVGEQESSECQFSRAKLGIKESAIVFASGANFFKIVPDLREAWANIISGVPNSVLLLYPFNPYWAGSYPAGRQLLHSLRETFLQHNISIDRLIIQPPLPHRVNVKGLLGTADIYLDAFPYSGATSLIDALETGLPTVVKDGYYLRTRQAGALLRELGIDQLVANTEQAYCELAVRLGKDATYRQQLKSLIISRMSQQPAFLDPSAFSARMGRVFQRIFAATNDSDIKSSNE
jgi:hypothetical protein